MIALLLLAGVLLYTAFGPDDDEAGAGEEVSEGESPTAEPTAQPVTGEDRAERLPVVGECLDGALEDDYFIICTTDV